MTYRKLFLVILTVSTLGLMGIWWLSSTTRCMMNFAVDTGSQGFTGELALDNGSFVFSYGGGRHSSYVNFLSHPRNPAFPELKPFGDFAFGKKAPSLLSGYMSSWTVVPVWFPYLLFVGSAYAFTRVMEGRSRSGAEKKLAGGSS
ncbi:MAG: hypothetical protein EOP88_12575 [Verrucomicrobiaceae bacterium]|nr:MAG: hypothetical protein EOP88_12575 [Verrucomicrobiaceae bacterium]